MKIVAPGPLARTMGRTRKAGTSGSGDFAKSLDGASETGVPPGTPGASQIASVDALLALQGEPDADNDGDRQETRRGHTLLDELEVIKTGLLVGRIPRGRLEALARMMERRQDLPSSPLLAGLIDEIELRVKVELAKLSAI